MKIRDQDPDLNLYAKSFLKICVHQKHGRQYHTKSPKNKLNKLDYKNPLKHNESSNYFNQRSYEKSGIKSSQKATTGVEFNG